MRVAIIGDYPLNVNHIQGGVQAAFAYLVKGLCQIDGLEVHIITLNSHNLSTQNQEQDGAILHVMPPLPRFEFARNYKTYQARLNSELAQIRPDVIHAQDAAADAYVALRSGYPAVITVHGVWRENSKYISSLRKRVRHHLHSLLIEQYNLKHTYHLIAISRYVTKYFANQLRPEAEVYYIPNAINDSFFNLKNRSDSQTVLFAGRVIQRKRVMDLVQAFALIVQQDPLAQLRIAGEYSSESAYAKSIRDFIHKHNLKDHVHLLGPLSEEAVLSEFVNCDMVALPSAQETTPMVIAQAMAAGKPVVATSVGGVAEMVNEGETGFLIDVGDIDGLANVLLRLLKNSSLRADLGQSAHRVAVENYRADSVARQTYDVYRSIVATER